MKVLALVDGVKRRFCRDAAAFAGFRGGAARQPFGFSRAYVLESGAQHQSASGGGLHAKSPGLLSVVVGAGSTGAGGVRKP